MAHPGTLWPRLHQVRRPQPVPIPAPVPTGLLAHIYDAEVPLLRGTPHPTAKPDYTASSADASPTGLEIVDLLAAAVKKVRANRRL